MSLEMVTEIKQAEDHAEKIVQDAKHEAAEIVAAAQEKALRLVENCVEQSALEQSQIIAQAEETANAEVTRLLEKNRAETEAMRQMTKQKMPQAIDYIIKEIIDA